MIFIMIMMIICLLCYYYHYYYYYYYYHYDYCKQTFINHGAFGGALEPLLYESNLWKYMCESQPLKFFDRY